MITGGQRQALEYGYELTLGNDIYLIDEAIGYGGSCIVYRAKRMVLGISQTYIIKEFYPKDLKITLEKEDYSVKILDAIVRKKDGTIEKMQNAKNEFEKLKEQFKNGLKDFVGFYESLPEYSLSPCFEIYDANGTTYSVSVISYGDILSESRNKIADLYGVAEIMLSLCTVTEKFHAERKLYLDFKPSNIYRQTKGGHEYISLFDFDTIISLEDLRECNYEYSSCSEGWAPAEQKRWLTSKSFGKAIEESTDIYSLGMVFFWLLTGRQPSTEKKGNTLSEMQAITAGTSYDLRAESGLLRNVSEETIILVKTILQKSLQRAPEARWGNIPSNEKATAMKEAMTQLLGLSFSVNHPGGGPIADVVKDVVQEIKNVTAEAKEEILRTIRSNANREKMLDADTAYLNHREPNSNNRFHYAQQKSVFVGREKEIAMLRKFCDTDIPFQWWVVCGEGGSGKSRLCFEFGKIMHEQNWTICYPANFDIAVLRRASEMLPNNTLFILDYSEFDMANITLWMTELQTTQYKSVKIRILLIQRQHQHFNELMRILNKTNTRISSFKYSVFHNSFLHIYTLNKDHIKEIIGSYSLRTHNKKLEPIEIDQLYLEILQIDKAFQRPLFAIIITDAYCEKSDEVFQWNNKNVLDYICEKEISRIISEINDLFKDNPQYKLQMNEIAIELLCFATMVGGIYVNSLEDVFQCIGQENPLNNFWTRKFCGLTQLFDTINGKPFCAALKPDIIGEYFLLYIITENVEYEVDKLLRLMNSAWKYEGGTGMNRFVQRLHQDFEEEYLNLIWFILSHRVCEQYHVYQDPSGKSIIKFGNADWIVLDVRSEKMLLLSKDILLRFSDFHDNDGYLSNEYINSEWLQKNFSPREQDLLLCFPESEYKITTLTIEELNRYLPFEHDRISQFQNSEDSGAQWWLKYFGRDPDFGDLEEAYIDENGGFHYIRDTVWRTRGGYRPIIWVKLE